MDYSYIRRAGVSVNLPNGVWKILLQSQGPACNWDAPGSLIRTGRSVFWRTKRGHRTKGHLKAPWIADRSRGQRSVPVSVPVPPHPLPAEQPGWALPNFPKAKLIRRAETVDPSFLAGLVCSDTGRIGTNDGAGRLMRTVSGNKAVAKSSCAR